MTDDVINNVQLKFQLEAERRQREYADRRYAWTEAYRHEFIAWQHEVAQVRAQLLRVLASRCSRTGQHIGHPGPPSPVS